MAPLAREPEPVGAGVALGVINDARRRQLRRRGIVLVVIAAALGAGAIVRQASSSGRDGDHAAASKEAQVVPAARLLTRSSGVGVACRVPNSIACDRIGVAVFLRQPAHAVSVSIAGRALKLDDPAWSATPRNGQRRMFAGFLAHAGLRGNGPLAVRPKNGPDRWTGADPVPVTVRVLVTYADGSERATEFRTDLGGGWG